jgi:hypothetical protein
VTDQQFENRGEPVRQAYGIDGTTADAQEVKHPFTPDPMNMAACVACGTGLFHSAHEEGA